VLLLDVLYVAAFIVLSPWTLGMIIFRPSFRAGIGARFRPALDAEPSRQTIWLHGSSAGEIDLLRALTGKIESLPGNYRIVISVFAVSGYTAAKNAFPQHTVIYFPVDFSPVVRRFLKVVQPNLIVLVESEFWPNFIATSHRAGIPVCVVNARMSDKSFRGHRWLPLIPWALRKLSMLAAQTAEDADRFRSLGVADDRLHVTGNMKYDLCEIGSHDEIRQLRRQLRTQYGVDTETPVVIAGSLHRGEDKAFASVYRRLLDAGQVLCLVLVPRYPAEARAMVSEFEQAGLVGVLKSGLKDDKQHVFRDRSHVLVVDTLGELRRFYTMSDIAYVGGSLHYRGSNKGGHNLMEPAVLGTAVLFGPHNYSFRETVRHLLEAGAGKLVYDQDELQASLAQLLDDPESRKEMGRRARQVVMNNRGAASQNLGLLRDYLPSGSVRSDSHSNEGIPIQS
jgi:3-deoxy-D-manno-octulosonic-acid transferase